MSKYFSIILLCLASAVGGGMYGYEKGNAKYKQEINREQTINTIVQNAVDRTSAAITQNAKESFDDVLSSTKTAIGAMQNDASTLIKLERPSVLVKPTTSGSNSKGNSNASGPDALLPYRAELSKEAFEFLAGEARRADYVAVQLKHARGRLQTCETILKEYNLSTQAYKKEK